MNIEQTYIVPSQSTFTIGTGLLGIVAEALVKAEEEKQETEFLENQLNKVDKLNEEIKEIEKQIAESKKAIAEAKVITEAKDKSIPTPVPGEHIDLTVDDINVKPVSPEAIKLTAIAKAMKDAQK